MPFCARQESAYYSYGNSVRPSVCPSVTTRYRIKATWHRDSGSSPYDSLESLVSYEVIWCHWARRFPSNEGIKQGYPLRNVYFTTIGTSSVKTVAERHRLASYHNEGSAPRGPAASSSAMACKGNAIPGRVLQPRNPVVQLGEDPRRP